MKRPKVLKKANPKDSDMPQEQRQSGLDLDGLLASIPHDLAQQFGQAGLRQLPSSDDLRAAIESNLNQKLLGAYIPLAERERLLERIFDQMTGLGVLEPLMRDRHITEIMVNGPKEVFVERNGQVEEAPVQFRDEKQLTDLILHIFSRANRPIHDWQPISDLCLDDGSRANAVLAPIAVNGPVLTIRKFCGIRHQSDALIAQDMLPASLLADLEEAIRQRQNIIICGGTGTGKTTLLNVLSAAIPAHERVLTIEDSLELQLSNRQHLVQLECRKQQQGPSCDMSQLIRAALRMRPDRLIVGEVRGSEAYDLMISMNTGHRGTLSTVHANSCQEVFSRLSALILESSRLPYEAILENLYQSLDLIVHIQRSPNGFRYVDEVVRIDRSTQPYQLIPIYRRTYVSS